jgi:putative endonuclease
MSASTDPRRALGALGERLAADHLARAGYDVVARNFRTRFGELDVIAADARYLVFCEVKTRVAGTRLGPAGPLDAIGPRKRRRLRAMAREWLASTSGEERPYRAELRFDAIGIVVTARGVLVSLEHVENAF